MSEELLQKLEEIPSIGRKKAISLVNDGVKTVSDLKKDKYFNQLSKEGQYFVKYNPQPIKYNTSKKIYEYMKEIIKYDILLVGSFRRETDIQNDLDFLIMSENKKKALDDIEKSINDSKYKFLPYKSGESGISGILFYSKKCIRVDFLVSYKKDYIYTLLYFTGSGLFNIIMRSIAKKKGMILNQYGLFKDGKKIRCDTEECVFKKLGIKYHTPPERTIKSKDELIGKLKT